MPFSDDCRLIASIAEQFGKSLLGTIKGVSIPDETIEVTVFSRLNHSSTRTADGVGYIAPIELHPIVRNPIHVWRRDATTVIRTKSLLAVIVCKDEDDIGRFFLAKSQLGKENRYPEKKSAS